MRQADILYELLREFFSGKKIIQEYVLGNQLRLDFYLPELNLAIEYNGAQHYRKVNHFHKDDAAFFSSLRRDEEKAFACQQLGINIIYFDYQDKLTLELVEQRFLLIGAGSGEVQDASLKNKPQEAKLRQKASRKERYRAYKNSEAYQEKLRKAKEFAKLRRAEKKSNHSTD